jgi:hypothetical protein
LSRHANRVPIYSINGGPKPMIYISKTEAARLEELGEVRRISRLKDPKLVMRFRALQKNPKRTNCSITSQETELHALAQVLHSDGKEESHRLKRIAEKISAWPFEQDDKATRVATKGLPR